MKNQTTRRSFIRTASGATFGAMVLPRHILGGPGFKAPSDTVNVAAIGAGGMGASNMSRLTSENIVAICDIDFEHVAASLRDRDGNIREERQALAAAYEKAKRYDDFRVMLEQQSDIDAVVIATPDHIHAIAAKTAMELGKHVYVQKPLTYSIHEARVLRDTARRTNVVTQMGNQGHSGDDARRGVELIWAGAIGPIKEVLVWTNRPKGYWPQGVARPEETPPVPKHIKWDLFLGPAPKVPYNPIYHPFNWRGWVDFGGGALGDMGAHLVDHPVWSLDLDYPTRVETRHTPWGGDENNPATYPLATVTYYEFARGGREPIKMTWMDGGLMPPTPPEMPADQEMNPGGGLMYIGEKGKLIQDTYGDNPRLLPVELEAEYADLPPTLPRIPGEDGKDGHEQNWIAAIRGETEPSCPFEYAAPLTEIMLLGVVAMRAGKPIEYDGANMRIPNAPEAEQYLSRNFREGWVV